MTEIKKAIIPVAGLGTRFLPLTKVLAKELLPLADSCMVNYVVSEVKSSDVNEIIFVLSEKKSIILDYFKKSSKIENILKSQEKQELLKELQEFEKEFEEISFSFVYQEKPKGDGDAILKCKNLIGKEPAGDLFGDDIFVSKIPVLAQLNQIFKTSEKLVIGLKKIAREKLSSYGVVEVEKIANRLYKIKEIVEKPKEISKAPSDLAICGRYIITPDVFSYLEKTPANEKGEIILAEALRAMLKDGKIIYGYEVDGEWLECGNKIEWLKSNLYLSLNHPKYGPILREAFKRYYDKSR